MSGTVTWYDGVAADITTDINDFMFDQNIDNFVVSSIATWTVNTATSFSIILTYDFLEGLSHSDCLPRVCISRTLCDIEEVFSNEGPDASKVFKVQQLKNVDRSDWAYCIKSDSVGWNPNPREGGGCGFSDMRDPGPSVHCPTGSPTSPSPTTRSPLTTNPATVSPITSSPTRGPTINESETRSVTMSISSLTLSEITSDSGIEMAFINSLAWFLGVNSSRISVAWAAGSVVATVTVSGIGAATLVNNLATANVATLSTVTGQTVDSTTIVTSSPTMSPSIAPPAAAATNSKTVTSLVVVAGVVVGSVLLLGAAVGLLVCNRKRGGNMRKTFKNDVNDLGSSFAFKSGFDRNQSGPRGLSEAGILQIRGGGKSEFELIVADLGSSKRKKKAKSRPTHKELPSSIDIFSGLRENDVHQWHKVFGNFIVQIETRLNTKQDLNAYGQLWKCKLFEFLIKTLTKIEDFTIVEEGGSGGKVVSFKANLVALAVTVLSWIDTNMFLPQEAEDNTSDSKRSLNCSSLSSHGLATPRPSSWFQRFLGKSTLSVSSSAPTGANRTRPALRQSEKLGKASSSSLEDSFILIREACRSVDTNTNQRKNNFTMTSFAGQGA